LSGSDSIIELSLIAVSRFSDAKKTPKPKIITRIATIENFFDIISIELFTLYGKWTG
jgi:hypothetical protein